MCLYSKSVWLIIDQSMIVYMVLHGWHVYMALHDWACMCVDL